MRIDAIILSFVCEMGMLKLTVIYCSGMRIGSKENTFKVMLDIALNYCNAS